MSSEDSFSTFHLFSELPGELRNKIWSHTLEPRRITLTCKTVSSMSRRANLPRPFSFTPCPASHDWPVEQFAWFTTEMSTPMALRVNKESRSYALQWYTAWRIWKADYGFRPKCSFKILMWDPTVDIVDFYNMNKRSFLQVERFLQLFVAQFPLQATQVQRLAVSSCLWESLNHDVVSRIWPVVECKSLKELIVDIDRDYETTIIRSKPFATTKPWNLPQDVEKMVVFVKEHHQKWAPHAIHEDWSPVIRVSWDKRDEFLRTDEKTSEVVLRCFPCPILEAISKIITG